MIAAVSRDCHTCRITFICCTRILCLFWVNGILIFLIIIIVFNVIVAVFVFLRRA